MDQENVEGDIDWRYHDQHPSGGLHNSLALQIFLEGLESNISRRAEQQDPQNILARRRESEESRATLRNAGNAKTDRSNDFLR